MDPDTRRNIRSGKLPLGPVKKYHRRLRFGSMWMPNIDYTRMYNESLVEMFSREGLEAVP